MIAAFLITIREVIEATLIVATILGILTKLKLFRLTRVVWLATLAATLGSFGFLVVGRLVGVEAQKLYSGRTEELVEGILMLVSAVFITWAVFWLHTYFSQHKLALLQKVKTTIDAGSSWQLFVLTFTAVFREGIEIVLFLGSIFFTSEGSGVIAGFAGGLGGGLLIAFLLFNASLKLPVYRTFQITTLLLILFAAGLAGRGVHELTEAGIIPATLSVTISLLPAKGHFLGDTLKALFGWSRNMDYVQLIIYAGYIAFMRWYIYERKVTKTDTDLSVT